MVGVFYKYNKDDFSVKVLISKKILISQITS